MGKQEMNYKSEHQQQVEEFMRLAKQEVPDKPTVPSEEVRLLRARLIYEECMETLEDGLGVIIRWDMNKKNPEGVVSPEFIIRKDFNMEELIDGCCDISVVTTGTLSACGIPDTPFQEEVDNNNLAKFGPGHSWREDGKLIKPPGHKPPNIKQILAALEFNQAMEEK